MLQSEYAQFKEELFGKINSPESMAKAFERIEKFNQDRGGKFAAMKHFGNGDFIACSDALCHHVHGNIPWAGDIEFMDMTSSLDRQDSKLMQQIMTTSPAGLPLGFCFLSSETEAIITEPPIIKISSS